MKIFFIVLVGLIILYFFYVEYKNKRNILRSFNRSYGEKPKDYYEDFDMTFVKRYYEERKENEPKGEAIDELTWNDLDMDSVFKRSNYTNTSLGEFYLYYKYREIINDNKDRDTIEKLVEIFMKNENLRNNIKLLLFKVGKLNDDKLIKFIYKPTFSRVTSYFKYPMLVLGMLLSIILAFINYKVGVAGILIFTCTNILVYQSAKIILEENFNVMIYLLNNIMLCNNLSKIQDKDFKIYKDEIKRVLDNFKDLKKIKKYSKTISKDRQGIFSDADILIQYIKMFFMMDIIAYENISKLLEKNKENLYPIYDIVAKLDLALSIAYYRKSLEQYTKPEFTEEDIMVLEDLYHPLIDEPVKNSININKNIIFTGSNASGKSTFIKSIAINCIMAQSLNTVLCTKYKCKFSKVVTSMAIRDNIIEGDSYFIAEIKSLKRLIGSLNSDINVIAFIDEILKGTNTTERIAASASILRYANNTSAKVLVATHDMELTEIIKEGYDNYHFRETITDDDVIFDYKLRKGASRTRNAIKLLEVMNFENIVVNDAIKLYEDFILNKQWNKA